MNYLEHLKKWKRVNGLSYKTFAELFDITDNYVYQIFSGRRRPSRKLLKKIAKKLGWDYYDAIRFFHGESQF